jgi:hypothetical protein
MRGSRVRVTQAAPSFPHHRSRGTPPFTGRLARAKPLISNPTEVPQIGCGYKLGRSLNTVAGSSQKSSTTTGSRRGCAGGDRMPGRIRERPSSPLCKHWERAWHATGIRRTRTLWKVFENWRLGDRRLVDCRTPGDCAIAIAPSHPNGPQYADQSKRTWVTETI